MYSQVSPRKIGYKYNNKWIDRSSITTFFLSIFPKKKSSWISCLCHAGIWKAELFLKESVWYISGKEYLTTNVLDNHEYATVAHLPALGGDNMRLSCEATA